VAEKRIVLRNCDVIDPKEITTYLDRDGFKALEKAYNMAPEKLLHYTAETAKLFYD